MFVSFQSPAFAYDKEIQLSDFVDWSYEHHIYLIGINKSSEYLKENGYNPYLDRISLAEVPNLDKLLDTITNLPDTVVDSLHGKTIYISTENGRGLAIPEQGLIENINPGFIIEQDINKYYIIHEIGHIVYHTLPQPELFSIDYSNIVQYEDRPAGFVTYYSLVNKHENFAEHFSYYVVRSQEFRDMATQDKLLDSKYNFLKYNVFDGIEY